MQKPFSSPASKANRKVVYARGAYRHFLQFGADEQARIIKLLAGCASGSMGHEVTRGMISLQALPGVRMVMAGDADCLTVLAFTGAGVKDIDADRKVAA
ncbi:MAG: hypothetical protein GC184_06510 [Rhizobiales bacterium]|nr:hypothetical protein [Hyphomicrobiales bacterium]